MTDQTQPTDAEIEALGHRMCWRYKHDTGVNHISTFTFNAQTLHDFARAVLAKWGTPAGAGEPWGACISGRVFVGKLPEHARKLAEADNLPIQWLYTTPQPTQAQAGAVPLTDEQIHAIYDEVARKEPYAGAVTRRNIVRAIEAAHGIKGADHA